MNGTIMLEIKNYNSDILHDISFQLLRGENLIILGANGAGKTTLAKVLCGLIKSNSVEINGQNPSKIYGKARSQNINYIPPTLEIFDEFMTAREFLALSQLSNSFQIDQLLTLLKIEHLSESFCRELSSGESGLLLIASALLHQADYTILDEPTSNLDPMRIREVFKLLSDPDILESRIIITHNLDLAYKLGYDILYLQDGTIAYGGDNQRFFESDSLNHYFDGSVKKIENNIVVAL
jgi:iron complex transport system ATP-binding protein